MHAFKLLLYNSFITGLFSAVANLSLYEASEFDFKTSYGFGTVSVVNKTLNMRSLTHIIRIFVESCSDLGRALFKEKEVLNLTAHLHRDVLSRVKAGAWHHNVFLSYHRIEFLLVARFIYDLCFKLVLYSEMRLINRMTSINKARLNMCGKLDWKRKYVLSCCQNTVLKSSGNKDSMEYFLLFLFSMSMFSSLLIEFDFFNAL